MFETLRIFANDTKKFCWTASQATRKKDRHKRLDLNDTADSMHKVRVADLGVTLNYKEDSDPPMMTLFCAKHRTGKSRFEVGPLPVGYEFGQLVVP